ncbi:RecX family transcriptional regulator [Aerococcaceae bacterium DSM 111020]|nr:RecX family transcriptional regulator [Aerococcaceae bacterium DSM 111020]
MKITKIEQQKKDKQRYSIYVDNEFLIGIDEQVLMDFALYKDQNISEDIIQRLKEAEQYSKFYQRALNYLSYQMRSVREVQDYLKKLSLTDHQDKAQTILLDSQTRQKIIDRLLSQGYLNDLQFGKSYVRTQATVNYKGPSNIRHELVKKGLTEDEIEDSLHEYPIDQQLENGLELAQKFVRTQKNKTPKIIKQKLLVHLINKGYGRDIIQYVMGEIQIEKDEEDLTLILEKDAEKSFKKRQRKFSGYELKQRIIQDLLRKGHSMDAINYWLLDNESLLTQE